MNVVMFNFSNFMEKFFAKKETFLFAMANGLNLSFIFFCIGLCAKNDFGKPLPSSSKDDRHSVVLI